MYKFCMISQYRSHKSLSLFFLFLCLTFTNYTNLLMIDGYHRRIYRRSLERTVILMELAELWNIRTFICHLWKTFMRFSNVPMGHVRLLRRILYDPRIIHVLHVLHVPRMLPLEYRMCVSASNFSGHTLPISRRYNLFRSSLILAAPLCECFSQTHVMSVNTPFATRSSTEQNRELPSAIC